jgi:hypothetical protein
MRHEGRLVKKYLVNVFLLTLSGSVFLGCSTSSHTLTDTALPSAPTTYEGIEIQGSPTFIHSTITVLGMLKKTQSFEVVQRYVSIIKEAEKSGMRAYDVKPTYEVGADTWQYSIVWYAGTIAHDAYHSRLYHEAKVWTGTEAERQCLAFQLQALKELNANEYLINYVEGLIEDPDYWSDYDNRYW